jgi:hypothetical protein
MEFMPLSILAIDLKNKSLVRAEYNPSKITPLLEFPAAHQPRLLAKSAAFTYFITAGESSACLYRAPNDNPDAFSLFFSDLSPMMQAALSPCGSEIIFVDKENTLCALSLENGSTRQFARPSDAACVGIFLTEKHIHTAWETKDGGNAAIFSRDYKLQHEYYLAAIPTNISALGEKTLLTFTQSPLHGEGLAVFSPAAKEKITSFCALKKNPAFQLYPCNIILDKARNLCYVLNEDSCSITCLNQAFEVVSFFSAGRSVSTMQLLGDSRFAVCGSNMFADLMLADMVNGKILSISDSAAEFSSLFLA